LARTADTIVGIDGRRPVRSGIRLEDYTGQSLGTLPQDDEYSEDGSEDESGDERSDDDYNDDDGDDSGEWISKSDEEEPEWGQRVSPLP